MRTEDIGQDIDFISSTQDEAIANVKGGRIMGMPPESFKDYSKEFAPEITRRSYAREATPIVARMVANTEVAAAMGPEIKTYSTIERMAGSALNIFKGMFGDQARYEELSYKMLRRGDPGSGDLTQDEQDEFTSLQELSKTNFGQVDYGESWGEALPGQILGAVVDIPLSYQRNPKLAAAFIAPNAALGAATGGVVGGGVFSAPGAAIGAGAGAVRGAAMGYLPVSAYDAFWRTSGSTYATLGNQTDELGNEIPIEEGERKAIAYGVGIVSGATAFVGGKLTQRYAPLLAKLGSAKWLSQLRSAPGQAGIKNALINIGKGAMSEGGEEAVQEFVQIIGEEIGKAPEDADDSTLFQGIMTAAAKLTVDPATQKRVGTAAVVGGAVGAGIVGGANVVQSQVDKRAPKAPPEVPKAKVDADKARPFRVAPTDLTPDVNKVQPPQDVELDVEGILKAQVFIDLQREAMQNSNLAKGDPEMLADFRWSFAQDNNQPHVWFDIEALRKLSDDPNKGAILRTMIGDADFNAENNIPIMVPTEVALAANDQIPELSEYMKMRPELGAPSDVEVYVKAREEAEVKRGQMLDKLKVDQGRTPTQKAYDFDLKPDVDDAGLVDSLKSQEVADAYLMRIASEDVELRAKADDEGLARNEGLRSRITAVKETLPTEVDVMETLREALETPQPNRKTFTEQDYVNQPSLVDAINKISPVKEADKLNQANREARQEVADNINETAQYEMNKVVEVVENQGTMVQVEIEAAKIANDPDFAVVDRFTGINDEWFPTSRYRTENELTVLHAKKGYSIFAIDPRLMTEDQSKKFAGNELLKQHKAFVKGGISPDNAAALVGVANGDLLLGILSKTPSRQDAIEARVKKQAENIRKEAENAVDLDKTSLRYAYNKKLANHMTEMQILWDSSRTELKAGIKRIAKSLPRKEDFTNRAKAVISQTPIGKLNANQFKIAERRSQNKAVDAVMKNDLETAFVNKGAAALNSELAIETHIATGKVNRAKKFFKMFDSRSVQAELNFAGELYVNAAAELLGIFNLSGGAKDVMEIGSFAKFVDRMIEQGIGDVSIPARLADPRQHVSELTVEQVLAVEDALRSILRNARHKNELIKKFGRDPKQYMTIEQKARELAAEAEKNPEYDLNKTLVNPSPSPLESFQRGADELLTRFIGTAEHILLRVDNDKVGGKFNQAIMAPLQGSVESGDGLMGKAKDMTDVKRKTDVIVKKFDTAAKDTKGGKWSKMAYNYFDIPEFQNNILLGKGRLSEAQLFVMLLNMGNEGNRQRLSENFGVSIDTIQAVLDRHLTDRHAVAAQSFMNMYAGYWDRVVDLQKRTVGTSPDKVEATRFSIGGKEYDGGYYPIMYSTDADYKEISRSTEDIKKVISGEATIDMSGKFYADDMTRHRHTEKRTGSSKPLTLNMSSIGMGFEMVVHDLNMRIPIANSLKVATKPEVARAITAVVGTNQYGTVINTIVRAASSTAIENNRLFNAEDTTSRLKSAFRAVLSTSAIAWRTTTALIQPTSLAYAMERMGPTSAKHMSLVLQELKTNPVRVATDMRAFAEDVLPSLKMSGGDVNENQRDPIQNLLPKKHINSVTHTLADMRDVANNSAFKVLEEIDNTQKVITIAAAYSQFISGDAPGYDFDTVMKMSESERHAQAKVYASSIARLTLTAGSIIDKSEFQHRDPMMAMFFNDVRNALNNHFRQGRRAKGAFVNGQYMDAGTMTAKMLMHMTLVKLMHDMIRGVPTPISSGDDEEEELGGVDWFDYIASSSLDMTIGSLPYVRDANYFASRIKYPGRRENASTPITFAITNAGYTWNAAMNFMEIVNGEYEISRNELKSIINTAGVVIGPLPTNALFDAYNKYDESDISQYTQPFGELFSKKLDKIEKIREEMPEDKRPTEAEMEALRYLNEQLNPTEVAKVDKERLPQGVITTAEEMDAAIEVIQTIESNGEWWAKNPNSSAAGLYQFLESTWQGIMDAAPELELTEAGRTSQDTTQQEKAMLWFTKDNARRLSRADIEVTAESLYAAHFLGANKAVAVLSAPSDMKLKDLVARNVMVANDFAGQMTVKGFKSWVSKKIDKAANRVAKIDNDAQ